MVAIQPCVELGRGCCMFAVYRRYGARRISDMVLELICGGCYYAGDTALRVFVQAAREAFLATRVHNSSILATRRGMSLQIWRCSPR